LNLGKLPWQGLKARDKMEKYTRIMEKKVATSTEQLCKGLPREFKLFLEAAKGLEFTETPKYDYFRQLLYDLYQRVPGGG
jgi:hypothetical protein